ncbi:MAG TPA: helix-turn-helix domain-containing protein [Reyranella sp.]|jgi:DNA-binding transcriptional regulator YiaG|nr:helix-turn-helix domain-containing protein [Reyranella sp.]
MGTGKLFHFTQSGLDNVWLANGWRVTKTPYGPSFSIERLDGLHEALARFIVESPLPMRGQDARYLRVMLDLSQADMGKLLGVSRATVIRWENAAKAPLDRVHDIAVRATYAAHRDGGSLVAATIKALQEADEARHGRAYRAVFEANRKGWRLAA